MKRTTVERILARVEVDEAGCWIFTGADNGHGYGSVWDSESRSRRGAHRVMYEAMVGPIPDGLHLDHLCRVRRRCNPGHLEPVEPAENTRRGAQARPKAEVCKYGHPYDEQNTRIHKNGRDCRECHRRRSLAYVHRKNKLRGAAA